tara:strand:- start:649 stop:1248 length:600 start_codon:yes stop_codon:yes gene_type:complete
MKDLLLGTKMKKTIIFLFVVFTCYSCKPGNKNNYFGQQTKSAENKLIPVDKRGLSLSYGIIKTIHGTITIKFFPTKAPKSIKRFLTLVQTGFYDGLSFHRAIDNFLIQSGDPTNSGFGGSGVKLKQEFNNSPHIKGTLALARDKDPDSADSQFYIALSTLPHLNGKYTVIGQVTKGLNVLDKISKGDKIISFTYNPNPY